MDCFVATLLAMTGTTSSWPGLTRPSTSSLPYAPKDVDARDKPGHDAVYFQCQRRIGNYAWLTTVLPRAACAAASRAMGTRYGEHET